MRIPAQEMAAKMRHAIATMTNDDLSKVGTEQRARQVERIDIMLETVDWIEQSDRKE